MSEQDSVAAVERSFAAWTSGDMPGVLGTFTEDVVWKVPGQSPLAGTYEGHEGIGRFFGAAFAKSQGSLHLELERVLADGDHSVFFMALAANRDGEPYEMTIASFSEHAADGRMKRHWFMPDDVTLLDQLFRE